MSTSRTKLLIVYLILLVPVVFVMNQWLPQPGPDDTIKGLLVASIKGLAVVLLGILLLAIHRYTSKRR